MLTSLVSAALATTAFGIASVLQADGARREPTAQRTDLLLLLRLLRHPVFVAAMGLSVAGFLLHLVALRDLPLFVVQPVIASSVAVTAVVNWWLGREPLGPRGRLLLVAVVVGLSLVTVSAETGDAVATTTAQRLVLLGVAALIAVVAVPAGRLHGTRGVTVIGLLSGLGYAVVAVAGRVMPSLAPSDLVADPAAYALVLAGGFAVLLYSTALQRGAVIPATAAMVVGNTVAPLLIGLLLLGDAVRAGWGVPAAVGVLLALTGAVLIDDPRAERDTPTPVT